MLHFCVHVDSFISFGMHAFEWRHEQNPFNKSVSMKYYAIYENKNKCCDVFVDMNCNREGKNTESRKMHTAIVWRNL